MTEREWREASDMRQSSLTLAAILAGAASLRFIGLGAGIPYGVGVDEPQIIDRAVGMMRSGSLHPHFYDYPSLFIYMQLAAACLRFMAGAMAGEWRSLAEVAPADFYVWGRAVTASFGTLTVLIVYLIGLRWGTRPALLGAALMAVVPLHVQQSHYILTDVPATFFVALTLLLALRAHEQPRGTTFAWAGAAAGLAGATKYPAALALLLPLLAVWMTPATRPSRLAGALAAVAAAGGAFLLGAPYTLLDLPAFLDGSARLMGSYTAAAPPEPAWILYLTHLRTSVQWPALLLMGGGVVLALVRSIRGPGRVRWALLVVFPLLYLWFISRQTLVFGRYLMPLLPFVCLLAATAIVSGVSQLRRFSIPRALRTTLIVALTVATLLPSAISSIRFNRTITRPGTPALAFAWLTRHAPHDATIVVESADLVLTYSPFRGRNVKQLRHRDYSHYVETGVNYLVASSHVYGPYFAAPHQFPREHAEYTRLFQQSEEVARFTPSSDHPGPELRILRVTVDRSD